MKFNTALAVFLLLAEPGSPFSNGPPATRSNLKRPRSFLSASPSDIAKYGRKVKTLVVVPEAKIDVVVPDAPIDVVVPDAPIEIITSPGASLRIPDIPDYVPAPNPAGPKTDGVTEFFTTARENYPTTRTSIVDSHNAGAMKGSVESIATTTHLPEGKVPTLVQFLTHGGPGAEGVHVDALANIKAKLGLMLGNAMSGFDTTLPAMAGPPEGSVGWVVAGVAIFVATGQRSAGLADAKAGMQGMVTTEDTALGKLSGEMKSMADEIKKLTTATGDLKKELYESKQKLAKKELQISKDQLKAMEMEAKLMQEIQKMQTHMKEGDRKVALLVQELEQTIKVREQLAEAMEKVKGMEADLRKARGEPEPEKEVEAETEPSVTIIEPDLLAILAERAKMVGAKKTAAKKPRKKTVKVVKGSTAKAEKEPEPFFLKDAEPKEEKPAPEVSKQPDKESIAEVSFKDAERKKKAAPEVSKKPAKEAKPAPEVSKKPDKESIVEVTFKDTERKEKPALEVSKKPAKEAEAALMNFRSLSKSTLSRKTVKQLMEFLEGEGAVTTGDDGKPLKKAVLVESVQSL